MAATEAQSYESDAIEAAAARLVVALEALEAAAERRREADRRAQALSDQFHALDNDRARLASELDEPPRGRSISKAPIARLPSASTRRLKPSAPC